MLRKKSPPVSSQPTRKPLPIENGYQMGIKFRKIKSKTPSELSLTGFGEVPSRIELL